MKHVLAASILALALLVSSSALSPTGSRAATVKYVAIGASDTVGVGAPDPRTQGWVPKLASLLGAETETLNLGVSGSLTRQALSEQLPNAIAADPDIVTVWLAVNDLNARVPLEVYAADLDTLLATLRSQTRARILVGNIPDLALVAMYADVDPTLLRAAVDQWNAAIAAVAARNGATLVDLYANWRELAEHPEYISGDGFHPSVEGHARLAELFYAATQS
jgi:lysophospholipase L1-like esterase